MNKLFFNPFVMFIYFLSYLSLDFSILSFSNIDTILYLIRTVLSVLTILYFIAQLTIKPQLISNYLPARKNLIFIIILFSYFSYILVMSMIFQTIILASVFKILTVVCFVVYFFLYSTYTTSYLKHFLVVLVALTLLNFSFFIFVPSIGRYGIENGGEYLKGVLNNRNSIILYTVPLILLSSYLIKNNILKSLLIVMGVLMSILTGSDTAVVIVVLLLFLMYFRPNIILTTIISLSINIAIILTASESKLFTYIIYEIIDSESGLNSRDFIWNQTLAQFEIYNLPNIILGYGIDSDELTLHLNSLMGTNGFYIDDPMNGVLSTLFFQGLIGLTILLFLIFSTVIKGSNIYSKHHYLLILYIPIIILNSVTENLMQLDILIFWIMLFIITNENSTLR